MSLKTAVPDEDTPVSKRAGSLENGVLDEIPALKIGKKLKKGFSSRPFFLIDFL